MTVQPSTQKDAYSISEFCQQVSISAPTYYKLKKLGLAPREMKIAGMIRISAAATQEWIAARENPTAAEAEQARVAADGRRARTRRAVARAKHCAAAA